jgi:hypothetical protein
VYPNRYPDAHEEGSLVTDLEDAVLWVLVVLLLWAMPLGLLGAAAGAQDQPWHRQRGSILTA